MARTLMARLPRLFLTCALVPKNPIAADFIVFGIILILGDFLFHIENGMMCVLIRIPLSCLLSWWCD